MFSSLGFDTVIVNNQYYDKDSLSSLFELIYPLDVRNFIFTYDFDLTLDSFSIKSPKIKSLKNYISSIAPRGVHAQVFYNLSFDKGSAFNLELHRLYAIKNQRSLITTLPLFTDTVYDTIAQDMNHLIYRKKAFPLFLNFDAVVETSPFEFCQKIMQLSAVGVGVDINYLYDPGKLHFSLSLLNSKTFFIPTISHHISNYVGIVNEAKYLMENIGKKNYYQLCGQIAKCSAKFNC